MASRGGQTPLYRRLPKRGLTNINRKEYRIVNLDVLNQFQCSEATPELLIETGMVSSEKKESKFVRNGNMRKS